MDISFVYLKAAELAGSLEFWLQLFIFATGLFGQYLVAKKRISGFYYWFAGNIAVIMTTFPKGMYGMALLYFVYIGFNLYSIREWNLDARRHDENKKGDVDEDEFSAVEGQQGAST